MNVNCEKKNQSFYGNLIKKLRNSESLAYEERKNLIIEFYSHLLFHMPSARQVAELLNIFGIPTISSKGKWNISAVKKLRSDIVIHDAREFIRMSKEDWVNKNGLKYANSLEEARKITEFYYSPPTKKITIRSKTN